jgi:hypothetical protein
LISATGETRTVANPTRSGVILTLYHYTDGGDITVTFSTAFTEDGATTFVFSDPGQTLTVQSIRTSATAYAWRKWTDHALANIAPADSTVLDDLSALTATAAEINARAAAASRRVAVTDAATYTVLAANSGKIHVMPNFTNSCTLALPTPADGLEYTFITDAVAADAQNWIFQGPSGVSYLGGLAFLDTDAGAGADEVHAGVFPNGTSNDFMTIVTPGAGTRIHLFCNGTAWIVNGQVFSATVPTFSDT